MPDILGQRITPTRALTEAHNYTHCQPLCNVGRTIQQLPAHIG